MKIADSSDIEMQEGALAQLSSRQSSNFIAGIFSEISMNFFGICACEAHNLIRYVILIPICLCLMIRSDERTHRSDLFSFRSIFACKDTTMKKSTYGCKKCDVYIIMIRL